MAKYETTFRGDFADFVQTLHEGIMTASASASFEGSSDYSAGEVKCAVRVYERFAAMGTGRSSLSVTVVESSGTIFVSLIASGGGGGLVFKVNTWSEKAFLQTAVDVVEEYTRLR